MTDLDSLLALRSASAYPAPRREGDYLPLVYGDLGDGEEGIWRLVPLDTAAFVYALAGHPLLPLAAGNRITLYDQDGAVIPAGDYTLDLAHDYQGLGAIATATFAADMKAKEPLAARGLGKAGEDGGLIADPVAILRDVLVGQAGLASGELLADSFSRAQARCRGLGFRAAGVITKRAKLGELASELLGGFLGSWWRAWDGRIKVAMDWGPGAGDEGELAHVFHEEHLKSPAVEAKLDQIVNAAAAVYRQNYVSGDYAARLEAAENEDPASQGLYGRREHEFELAWVREETVARAVCARLVTLLSRPRRQISCEEDSLAGLHLERGDAALVSLDFLSDEHGLPLKNQIVRVLSLEPELDRATVRYTLLDTGHYKTTAALADGSLLAAGAAQAGAQRDRATY